MKTMTRWALAGALTFAMMMGATPASADVDGGTGEVEVYVGWLWPDDIADEFDDFTGGVRLGYNVTEHFGITGSLGYWQANDTADVGLGLGDVDLEGFFFDLSFEWIVNPDSRANFILFGGPGYASFNLDQKGVFDDDEGVFTMHAGVAGKFQVTDIFYIRPDARVRWHDSDWTNDEFYDWEASVGFGWYLGR